MSAPVFVYGGMIIASLAGALLGGALFTPAPPAAATPPDPYRIPYGNGTYGPTVHRWVDPDTGCQYLYLAGSGGILIPRESGKGHPLCTPQ